MASGSGDTCVRLWDLNTQLPQHECKGHKNWVLVVDWAPDASCVISGDMDGSLWMWDPKKGEHQLHTLSYVLCHSELGLP